MTRALSNKIASGLPVHLIVDLEMGHPPRRTTVGTCAVRYDLWDEVYRLSLPSRPNLAAMTPDAVVRQCTDAAAYRAALAAVPRSAFPRIVVHE